MLWGGGKPPYYIPGRKEAGIEGMQEPTFEYGGKHFAPVRKFGKKDGDFYQITRRLRSDREFGFFRADYYGKDSQKAEYSHEGFYAASTDKTCDIFRCVENGKLYVPCENELQEYMEVPQKNRGRDYER